jgi:hypothetical protein
MPFLIISDFRPRKAMLQSMVQMLLIQRRNRWNQPVKGYNQISMILCVIKHINACISCTGYISDE